MTYLPVESFIIQRLQEGGWRVIQRKADLTNLLVADFVSYGEAEEWVNWKSGHPKINPYAMAEEVYTQPWLVEIAIEPKLKADGESGQTILKGASELHLDTKLDVVRRTYNIDARVGAPQVAFRECITQPAEVEYAHKKRSGGAGQFAGVRLHVEPNDPGKGYQFESKITGGAVPKKYIPGVEKGIESVLASGVVAGFPVVDVKIALIDGKYHDVDSSALAFEIAARAAFREALQKAGSVLIEPIMKLEVVTPEDCIGSIIGDLNLRRGRIQGQDMRGNVTVIKAMVPLMNMFGYVNNLRSMSQGRATFTMLFVHYAPAPLPEDDPPFRPAIGMRA